MAPVSRQAAGLAVRASVSRPALKTCPRALFVFRLHTSIAMHANDMCSTEAYKLQKCTSLTLLNAVPIPGQADAMAAANPV